MFAQDDGRRHFGVADESAQLANLDLSNNKFSSDGFEVIIEQLKFEHMQLDTLNMTNNNIKYIQGKIVDKEIDTRVISIVHLILD